MIMREAYSRLECLPHQEPDRAAFGMLETLANRLGNPSTRKRFYRADKFIKTFSEGISLEGFLSLWRRFHFDSLFDSMETVLPITSGYTQFFVNSDDILFKELERKTFPDKNIASLALMVNTTLVSKEYDILKYEVKNITHNWGLLMLELEKSPLYFLKLNKEGEPTAGLQYEHYKGPIEMKIPLPQYLLPGRLTEDFIDAITHQNRGKFNKMMSNLEKKISPAKKGEKGLDNEINIDNTFEDLRMHPQHVCNFMEKIITYFVEHFYETRLGLPVNTERLYKTIGKLTFEISRKMPNYYDGRYFFHVELKIPLDKNRKINHKDIIVKTNRIYDTQLINEPDLSIIFRYKSNDSIKEKIARKGAKLDDINGFRIITKETADYYGILSKMARDYRMMLGHSHPYDVMIRPTGYQGFNSRFHIDENPCEIQAMDNNMFINNNEGAPGKYHQ